MSNQLTLNFKTGLSEAYATCREYVSMRSHNLGVMQKTIAMDMDYSPSDLTRKLAQSPSDSRRFTLDDLEKYIEVTKDTKPILYLVDKYLANESEEELKARIAELQQKLQEKH